MTSCILLSSQWLKPFKFLTAPAGIAKLARLMSPDLPQHIEPARLADHQESLTGSLGLENMHRLQALVENPDARITFHLTFDRDDSGAVVISGDFSTDLVMRCQRCLEPLAVHLDKTIRIGWINSEAEAEVLPAELEPLLAEDDRIALAQLIEDEVLLGLPMAPLHEPGACAAADLLQELTPERENPFAVLKDLKIDKH